MYGFVTDALPAGSDEVRVAIDESRDEGYGQGGTANGATVAFALPASGAAMRFTYDPAHARADDRRADFTAQVRAPSGKKLAVASATASRDAAALLRTTLG